MNKKTFKSLFYIFFPLIIGGIIGILINSNIDYNNLIKPPLSPPSILFPIVWSILYLLMGISYFILKKKNNDNIIISFVYYTQLFVNFLWSIIFFNLEWRLFSIIWIIILDILVITMIYLFSKKDKLAAYLNIPYLIWILFATYLTIGIYILN